jgi:hypothetical protein
MRPNGAIRPNELRGEGKSLNSRATEYRDESADAFNTANKTAEYIEQQRRYMNQNGWKQLVSVDRAKGKGRNPKGRY